MIFKQKHKVKKARNDEMTRKSKSRANSVDFQYSRELKKQDFFPSFSLGTIIFATKNSIQFQINFL